MKFLWLTLSLLLALSNTVAMTHDGVESLSSSPDFSGIVSDGLGPQSHGSNKGGDDERATHVHCCHAHSHFFVTPSVAMVNSPALQPAHAWARTAQPLRHHYTPPTPPPKA